MDICAENTVEFLIELESRKLENVIAFLNILLICGIFCLWDMCNTIKLLAHTFKFLEMFSEV